MDYNEWGAQYLEEARRLKEHILPLRCQARNCSNETAQKLCRRISLLNEMYLDCLHTGNYLIECGKKFENQYYGYDDVKYEEKIKFEH